ncbi:hypothetical protein [Photorhabdus laumondii]|uniref:Photorhabdus luminescens subsp. laumondii TTO1 complete genome segment 2/17 n=1 Tax=Photorhabdus laumondii subsp. laumondii (strain DSM 15139 / CIP 105565 / TT01) TaxID=243265 RepID=Q7N920_PHOLL|nr:hypothetical protein [Photorhabdus laumondii]AXG45833.1 hypothetical protein PluTT01m_02725 [Photorhabdus laumondii subsp. laumondii]KTL59476.1 hypothetical protein AA106_17080 [Photorhabdus laumondii subsp. laumondii]CAE12829.1 unnamed protein product [Photorhabdus laumondii subsp. laumondii TTO1]
MTERIELIELISGLDSYLENGYVNADSYEDPSDDAIDYLGELLLKDSECCLDFCKKILDSDLFNNNSVKSTALDFLILSESNWFEAFSYLLNKAEKLSTPELEKALFYFYCAKNDPKPYPVPEGLFNKLIERYQVLKTESDANFCHLHETYNDFIKAYSLKF